MNNLPGENNRHDDVAAKPLCGANWPTPCADCVGSCGIEEYIEEQDARSAATVYRKPDSHQLEMIAVALLDPKAYPKLREQMAADVRRWAEYEECSDA